jgi:hypothetical protein
MKNFACSIFYIMFWCFRFNHYFYDLLFFFLDTLIKVLLFLISPFNPIQVYNFFFHFILHSFDFCLFVNVFILFNLTLKLKICYCLLIIFFLRFNPHFLLLFFIMVFFCLVFLCNFNPHNFFMYSAFSLIIQVIVWKINRDWNLFGFISFSI